MADKQVLERMLSMLPEEFQNIYYETYQGKGRRGDYL